MHLYGDSSIKSVLSFFYCPSLKLIDILKFLSESIFLVYLVDVTKGIACCVYSLWNMTGRCSLFIINPDLSATFFIYQQAGNC